MSASNAPSRVDAFDIVIIGGEAAGITVAAEMRRHQKSLSIKTSPLANEAGWVSVDPATLQHTRFSNVFGLGDAAGTTNAKTAAAVRLQAPMVLRNLLPHLDGTTLSAVYDGYGSCPPTTGYGKVVLAEFGYGGKVTPSFPLDPRVPRLSAWLLKQNFRPYTYWNWMLKGSEFDIKHRERSFSKAA